MYSPARREREEMGSTNMTIRGAAHELGVHENTIRNWIAKDLLRAVRLPSGVRRVPASEVQRVRLSMVPVPDNLGEVGAPTVAKSASEPLESAERLPSSF